MAGRKALGYYYGTSFDAKHWLSLDVCGCCGITVSWCMHGYALFVLFQYVVTWESPTLLLLFWCGYVPVAVLAVTSLFQASTTDPGAVPLGARPFTVVQRAKPPTISSGDGPVSAAMAASGGTAPRSNNNNPARSTSSSTTRSLRRCHKCNDNYKPARAHHDSVTGRCIVKFDHFCPWVNNAVGILNHKFFCLFLLYTCLSCILALVCLLVRFLLCSGYYENNWHDDSSTTASNHNDSGRYPTSEGSFLRALTPIDTGNKSRYNYPACTDFLHTHSVAILVLVASALVFLVFTAAMSCEQIEAIQTGQGKIARMKQSVGQAGTELSRVTTEFNEMFGGNSPYVAWHWFIPIRVQYPRGMKQVVLGYEFNETCVRAPYKEPNDTACIDENDCGDIEAPMNNNNVRPERDGLMMIRETSNASSSVKKRVNRLSDDESMSVDGNNDDNDDMSKESSGILLVERTKARVI